MGAYMCVCGWVWWLAGCGGGADIILCALNWLYNKALAERQSAGVPKFEGTHSSVDTDRLGTCNVLILGCRASSLHIIFFLHWQLSPSRNIIYKLFLAEKQLPEIRVPNAKLSTLISDKGSFRVS